MGVSKIGGAMSEVVSLFLGMAFVLLIPVVFGQIFKKAGWSAWWGLLALLPGFALLIVLFLAWVPWPSQRELAVARANSGRFQPDDIERALGEAVESYAKGNHKKAVAICERLSYVGDEARSLLENLKRQST